MINYEIVSLDYTENLLTVRYWEEGKEDCFVPIYLPSEIATNISEEAIHDTARANAITATIFWKESERGSQQFSDVFNTLSSTTGVVKEIVAEDAPEFEDNLYELFPKITETDTQIIHGWELVPLTDSQREKAVRVRRDVLLSETDVECLSDRSPSQEMIDYRQALRDLPMQEGFPNSVVWPIKPSSGNDV